MATKHTPTPKTIRLTTPTGTQVTVAADDAERYKAKGYKAAATTRPKPKTDGAE